MAFIYRFKNKHDEVIYIGYTGQSLDKRMNQHFSNKGHLDNKCYSSVERIEYQKYKTKSDAQIMEVVEINRYKPLYNKLNKQTDNMTLDINENEWKLYKQIKPVNKQTMQNTGIIWKLVAFGYLLYMIMKLFGIL